MFKNSLLAICGILFSASFTANAYIPSVDYILNQANQKKSAFRVVYLKSEVTFENSTEASSSTDQFIEHWVIDFIKQQYSLLLQPVGQDVVLYKKLNTAWKDASKVGKIWMGFGVSGTRYSIEELFPWMISESKNIKVVLGHVNRIPFFEFLLPDYPSVRFYKNNYRPFYVKDGFTEVTFQSYSSDAVVSVPKNVLAVSGNDYKATYSLLEFKLGKKDLPALATSSAVLDESSIKVSIDYLGHFR